MTFAKYYEKENLESVPFTNFTFGEEVWKDARKDLLRAQRRRKAKKRKAKK